MELIIGIIIFIAFGVITDAIEGNKKRGKSLPPPKRQQTPRQAQTRTEQQPNRQPVPKIKMEPQKPVYHAGSTAAMYRGKSAGAQRSETARDSSVSALTDLPDRNQLKPADIHSDVLLHAVAYAQILQPPKAYQYMATRSCRGDWNNNK